MYNKTYYYIIVPEKEDNIIFKIISYIKLTRRHKTTSKI